MYKSSPSISVLRAFMLLLVFGTTDIIAAKVARHNKYQGPSQEEYYSTAAKNISPEDRKRADDLRVKTIDSIASLLKEKKIKGSRKFELRLRLGELYAERHDYLRDKEITEYSKKYDTWMAKNKKGREPRLSNKNSQAHLAKAANAFRKLVREFPKSRRTAAALYALGKTLARMGSDSSIIYFEQLVKNHPRSPLVADTHLAIADYYFEQHKMSKSVASYKKALKYKKHKAYPYAVYKLGWAFFNSTPKNDKEAKRNIQKSITSFKLVIRLSDKDEQTRSGRLHLKEEALNDLIVVWSETEDTNQAWAYFKTIGEKDSFYKLLAKLGSIYSDQGRNGKAIAVYNRLVSEDPNGEENPETYEKIVQLHDKMGNTAQVVSTLKKMDELYVVNSPWIRKHKGKTDLLASAKSIVEFNLHRYGTLHHTRGQKSNSKKRLVAAAQIYGVYLTSFPKGKNSYDIKFYFADIMFEFKKYELAAQNYLAVANEKPKKGKHLKEAAMNAVVALNKLDQQTKYAKLPQAGQVPEPLDIPENKKKLLNGLETYVKLLPKEKNGYPMRYTIAETHFSYGHYDRALKSFEAIVKELPKTAQAKSSIRVIIGYHLEKKSWDKAIALSRQYINDKKISNKNLTVYLVGSLRKSLYNKALDLDTAGKHADAGKAFLAYQKEFSWEKTSAGNALFNAGNNFFKAAMLEDALAANKLLVDKYPKTPKVRDAILNIAQTYEALAQFDNAAAYYKKFAYNYPRNSLASRSLYNAATLYKGVSQISTAKNLFTRYVRLYPRNKIHNEVKLEVAELQEQLKHYKSAVAAFKDFSKTATNPDDKYYADAKVAILTENHVSKKKGNKLINSMKRQLKKKNSPTALEARRLISEFIFNGIEPTYFAYQRSDISTGKKSIESRIQSKQSKLVRLAKKYEEVLAIGSPEYSVASLFRLGQSHENFAQNLFTLPAPKGSSQVEINQFKSTIDKLAFPLKEEAYKFYETSFKRSKEVETFTAWTRKTYDKMVELAPSKHPEVIEQSADPKYMVHKVKIEPAVATLAH